MHPFLARKKSLVKWSEGEWVCIKCRRKFQFEYLAVGVSHISVGVCTVDLHDLYQIQSDSVRIKNVYRIVHSVLRTEIYRTCLHSETYKLLTIFFVGNHTDLIADRCEHKLGRKCIVAYGVGTKHPV